MKVDRALRALDSIAAEARSLSTSLGRTTSTPASAVTTSPRNPAPQTSTAIVVGNQRDTKTRGGPKSPGIQTAKSVDSSGVIKRHLDHLESIFRPGASDAATVKKSVSLRKPRPLRKAQTVDLTSHGIGVDPELMQLLRTRKEKSASDDEDSAAKQREDVVSVRYCDRYSAV